MCLSLNCLQVKATSSFISLLEICFHQENYEKLLYFHTGKNHARTDLIAITFLCFKMTAYNKNDLERLIYSFKPIQFAASH